MMKKYKPSHYLNNHHNKYATIRVDSESTGAIRYFTDSGNGYIEIEEV